MSAAAADSGTVSAPFDIAVIGAGIVGASVALHASALARVLLLEGEAAAGYHTTGRSAALFAEGYGPPQVRALTRASRAFFERPPPGFCEHALLGARGALFVGPQPQHEQAEALRAQLLREGCAARRLGADAARSLVPVLRPEAAATALFDPGAFDIDVDALLQGCLRGARAAGAVFVREARVGTLRRDGGRWRIGTEGGGTFAARVVVNAAGAWADEVARLAGAAPVGLEPRRRSAFVFRPPADQATHAWPAVIALDETWYFKPDAGLLLGSPANADLVPPHDVVAEELDVALGIERIEAATTLVVGRPRRTWAGLRSFVPDGEPVCGFDPGVEGFFWAAALGGYGIQTSPAFGRLCASLLLRAPLPADLAAQGLQPERLAPRRPAAANA